MKNIFNGINFPVLLVSFLIGLVFVHISRPNKERILVHPTPDNSGQIEYADKVGTCFSFSSIPAECPKEGGKQIPIQE